MGDPYALLAPHYDALIGRQEDVSFVASLLHERHPSAQSLLELGCGTGRLLVPFADWYDVVGVDQSEAMLAQAATYLPRENLILGDMTRVALSRKFDIVMCVFNSINHVVSFKDWRSLFRVAKAHLSPGGVFVFDMYTPYALDSYGRLGAIVYEDASRFVTTNYVSGKRGLVNIHVDIFLHKAKKAYERESTVISERSFELSKVRKVLQTYFSKVQVIDPERTRPSARSEVVYWICRV